MATQKQVFTEITESIDRCNHTLPGLIQFLKNGFQKLENASGGGGGGSTVEWTQIQASGTKIAEIEIDGDKTSVYAPIPFKASSVVSATSGATTATITDSAITTTSTIDIFSETSSGALINVKSCVVTTGQAVLSFDALEEAASFKLHIYN